MADNIGAKVASTEVKDRMDVQQGSLMFPSYDPNNFKKHVVINQDDKCAREVVLDFNVNFAVFATDAGTTKKFLELAGSLIDMSKAGLGPVTVINGIGQTIDTVEEAIKQSEAKGHQKFHFPVHLCCHQKYQPFRVELEVDTRWLITDTSSDTDTVHLDMHLRAHTARDDKDRDLTGKKAGTSLAQAHTERLTCEFVTDTDFEVVVWFNEHCKATWSPNPTPWISLIRFDHLRIIITTAAECKEGTVPVFKINDDHPESGKPKRGGPPGGSAPRD